MPQYSGFQSSAQAVPFAGAAVVRDGKALRAAFIMGVAYYFGAKLGFLLTAASSPVSVLWPPNALLLGALLLAPTRWWWLLIAGAFPAHLLAEAQGGVPMPMVLGWFASNVSEALIGASAARWLAGGHVRLDTVRGVATFLAAAVAASVLSSFLDAAFVRVFDWMSTGYWTLWRSRVFSNVLATITFAGVIVAWSGERGRLSRTSRARRWEGAVLLAGLVTASFFAFDSRLMPGEAAARSLVYLPLPFLVWAAVRFGPALASLSFAIVAFLLIWGAGHGNGPFYSPLHPQDALPIQLFLVSLAVPQMLLAAVIRERRQAERQLSASQEFFSRAFHASPVAAAISSAGDGAIIEANERWLELLQYPPGAVEPGSIAPLASHLGAPDQARLAAALRDGGPLRDVEVVLRDCQGAARNALVSMSPVQVRGRDCLLYVVRDITQQREAESDAREQRQQLFHLNRVASVTEFSSTLAHELSQPLTAILSSAQAALSFVARQPSLAPEIRAILDEIVVADRRASNLIVHLRRLMKKGEEEFAPLDLNRAVEDVAGFVRGEFALRNVEASFHYAPGLPPVHGDAVQLQQLLLNLISNACDAMQATPAPRHLTVTTLPGPGGDVQLTVADTGPGIRADLADRIFEPFYTTKEGGLGLGLSICRRIALAHGGTLRAEPGENGGACFRLAFPAAC